MDTHNFVKLQSVGRISVFTVILLICSSASILWLTDESTRNSRTNFRTGDSDIIASPPIPELQIYKPLLPEEAKEENANLPFSTAPIERALPLVLPPDEILLAGRRNATDCLTSAIYYEAGNELSQGKRAVAQVILNRVRHPAYPKTICGVVYQGSERKTGCQFTFTCDGSLSRQPTRDGWEKARRIAASAISGSVEASVGMSTHYHANYVMPYWAPTLDKVSQIGTHIFYRWKGTWGRRRAFSQTVQLDSEPSALAISDGLLPVSDEILVAEPAPQKLASRIIADDLPPGSALILPTSEINARVTSDIQADQTKSKLAVDEKVLIKN